MCANKVNFNTTTKELFVSKDMSSVDVFKEIEVNLDDFLKKGLQVNFTLTHNEKVILSRAINSKSEREELINELKLLTHRSQQ